MDSISDKLHVVVFPWLAFGHMLPYLELSKCLAQRGHQISFISTPRNIQRLPKLPPQLSNLVRFIPLELPKVDGLPETAEATSDLPSEAVEHLKKAFDRLDRPFKEFIQRSASRKPDWIIHDFAHHWIPEIAAEAGVPTIFLSIFIAGFLVFFGPMSELADGGSRTTPEAYTVPPPWIPFQSNLRYRLHEARRIFEDNYKPNVTGFSDLDRYRIVLDGCTAVAVRSCREVESEWLGLLPRIVRKPVLPVGLLPPPTPDGRDESNVISWLDAQAPRSVVYVAFGSEAALSTELTHGLAHGLELAKLPFVWAFRGRASDLPSGFEDRTRERGIVARGWVPQVKILGHEAVGGFLTHLGWSSVIESLQFGLPLVLLPIFADQGINARVVMETGIAVEVERGEEDGFFTGEAVARALRLAVADQEGECHRRRAKELTKIFADGDRERKYVDDFVRYLQQKKHANGTGDRGPADGVQRENSSFS